MALCSPKEIDAPAEASPRSWGGCPAAFSENFEQLKLSAIYDVSTGDGDRRVLPESVDSAGWLLRHA